MSTVVYQGLQSCLESQLVESRTLRLKLASPKPNFSQPLELAFKSSSFLDANSKELKEECHSDIITKTPCSSNSNIGGWSFIQSLSTLSYSPKQHIERENSYVHPLVKRSLSTLSEKSLELCTENLGSETGTDITESSIFAFSSWDNYAENSPLREQPKPRELLGAKKVSARSFPPPLTTLRGSESLQFRPHREDGRLVIKAVKTPLKKILFQVERSHGRLRLSFLKNNAPDSDLGVFVAEENEGGIEIRERECYENEVSYEEEEDEEEEEEEEEEERDVLLSEDMDGNNMDVGARMGMGKYQRPSRCNEDRHGNKEALLNLEPFLVATS